MAKITITIEDMPDGRVSTKAEPNFSFIAKLDITGHGLTPAHGYAMVALNAIRAASNAQGKIQVAIPRARRKG